MSLTERPSGLSVIQYKSSGPDASPVAGLDQGYYPPLWSSGTQADAYGYHENSYPQAQFDVLYRTQPFVAAVVNKLVRQIARTPIIVEREGADGECTPITPYSQDPGAGLAKLLRRPTPRKSQLSLKQWMAWPSLIFGNSLIAKFHGDGPDFPPTELIPMDWRFVTPYAQPGGEIELWQTTQLGNPRYVDALTTMHFGWETCGPIGVSPLQQLAISVILEDAAQRLQVSSFRNASRPSGAIALPPGSNPNPMQMTQMRKDIESLHRGVDNAFKVALLAPGAQWVPMMFSMQEAEMMATRQYNRDEVCSVYDVKPAQIGIMSEGQFGSSIETNRDLYRTTLPPWFSLFEDTLNVQLVDPEPLWEGLRVRFDASAMLRGDPEALAAQIATQIGTGQITINEGRDANGLPRIHEAWADQLYMQTVSNYAPLGQQVVSTNPYPPPAGTPTGPTAPTGPTNPQAPVPPTGY